MKYLLAGRWNTLVFQYFNFRRKKPLLPNKALSVKLKDALFKNMTILYN
jgi:hypothetical protein